MRKLLAMLTILIVGCATAYPQSAFEETRRCPGPIKRTVDGSILRRADVLIAFRNLYPCPETGRSTGACPGWAIDHVIPLAVGGCDAVRNLQWLPHSLKSAPVTGKDRFERLIYATPPQMFHAK